MNAADFSTTRDIIRVVIGGRGFNIVFPSTFLQQIPTFHANDDENIFLQNKKSPGVGGRMEKGNPSPAEIKGYAPVSTCLYSIPD